MNTALWVMQGIVAFACVAAGSFKLVTPRQKLATKMGWANDFTDGQVKLIGLAEVLGAVGLVVPWATHIMPRLTPVAAACLVVIMVGATMTHVRRKEPAFPPLVLAILSAVVAVGRSGMLG